ncbi:MAG: hypothetical protein GY750_09680 [Lentisphaerae bacterium]|nr:hypothetical protein [Lentisphaerota bacterium]MCP4101681.1 hypothetical protein [Lentisphaerota bacterium]
MNGERTIAPIVHAPQPVKYPASYYRMANTAFCGMLHRFNTLEQIKLYLKKNENRLAPRLYSLGIRIMDDYRKTNFNRIIHMKRHNTKFADELIAKFKSCKNCNSTEPFAQIINDFIEILQLKIINQNEEKTKVINTTGSFFRRLLFLKQMAPQSYNVDYFSLDEYDQRGHKARLSIDHGRNHSIVSTCSSLGLCDVNIIK